MDHTNQTDNTCRAPISARSKEEIVVQASQRLTDHDTTWHVRPQEKIWRQLRRDNSRRLGVASGSRNRVTSAYYSYRFSMPYVMSNTSYIMVLT
jgi:hypothetical protein